MRVAPPTLSARLTSGGRHVAKALAVALTLVTAAVLTLVHAHLHAHPRSLATIGLGPSGEPVSLLSSSNPSESRGPGPDFVRTCLPTASGYHGDLRACDHWAEVNINRARRDEGLRDIRLPGNFIWHTMHGQLIIAANAERTSRGLPALDVSDSLDARAQAAADADTDPTGPSGMTWVSNWAGNYRTPLAADYAWMYDDGLHGTNEDCTSSSTAQCWAHRDNILAAFRGSMGASQVRVGHGWSATEVMVKG